MKKVCQGDILGFILLKINGMGWTKVVGEFELTDWNK